MRKNIAEAKLVSPICSASGIGSINFLRFLIMDRNISRNQICVHYTQVLSSVGKQTITLLHQHKRVRQEMPFQAPSEDDCRAHRNSLNSDNSFPLLDKSFKQILLIPKAESSSVHDGAGECRLVRSFECSVEQVYV